VCPRLPDLDALSPPPRQPSPLFFAPSLLLFSRELFLPPTSSRAGTCIVSGQALKVQGMEAALSNSFGFGGVNASLLFARM
jgi:hypothetical protein